MASGFSDPCIPTVRIAEFLQARQWPMPLDCSGALEQRLDSFPGGVCTLNLPSNPLAYLSRHAPVAFPIGGTRNSLFSVMRSENESLMHALYSVHNPTPPGLIQGCFYPVDKGSSVLFSVQLRLSSPAEGEFLTAVGATEITNSAIAPYTRKRFAPTQAFVDGNWQAAMTDQAALENLLLQGALAYYHELQYPVQ